MVSVLRVEGNADGDRAVGGRQITNGDLRRKDGEIPFPRMEVRVVDRRNGGAPRSRTTVAGLPVTWDNLLDDELRAVLMEVKYHRSLLVLSAWHY